MPISPIVSIVICTYRRPELLCIALESLAAHENLPPGAFEIIIVDNDQIPNPAVQDVAAGFIDRLPLQYIHEPQVGLSYARNTGGQAARAQYVSYIDDDTRLPPLYIHTLMRVLETVIPDFCGGPYRPFYLDSKPSWYKDEYGAGGHGETARCLTANEFVYGMNMAAEKRLLESLGWFNPVYGMAGGKLGYGEETALQIKAWKHKPDLKVYYDPALILEHLVPQRKMKITWRFKNAYSIGFSQAHLWEREDETRDRLIILLNLLRTFLSLVANLTTRFLHRDCTRYPHRMNYHYEVTARNFSSLGYLVRSFSRQGQE